MFYAVCTLCGIIAGWLLVRAIDHYPTSAFAQILDLMEKHIEQEDMLTVDNNLLVVTATSAAEEDGVRLTLRHSIEYDLTKWTNRDDPEKIDRLYRAAMDDTNRQIGEDLERIGELKDEIDTPD